jgi:hypothetical protein
VVGGWSERIDGYSVSLTNVFMNFNGVRKTAFILFAGLFGCYLSLSPGAIAGQGYAAEEIDSGLRMLSVATAWIKGHPVPPMVWSRHGPVPVLFDLPFLKLGKLLVSPDFMLSFQPVLLTSGLVTVLYLWLRKLCSPGMSLFLTLTAAFGTMLWPYAYIGLETEQSFFVLLAGYLALADGKIRTWPRLLLFAVVCALAISVKSTGITLSPVIAYLIYHQFRSDWRSHRVHILISVLIIGTIWALGHWGTNAYWGPRGGGGSSLRPWLIDSPIQLFSNMIGLFGSPTTGLLVYAPVVMVGLFGVARSFRTNRSVTIFALLITLCALGFLCLLKFSADDVWACRYMHLVIAPFILCIGSAFPHFEWKRDIVLVALAAFGVWISFLGAFYYYGLVEFAAKEVNQNTMEWMTGDPDWNHILFNARLFRAWAGGVGSVPWSTQHIWTWSPPAEPMQWKSVDLVKYCQPQSFMFRYWHIPLTGIARAIFVMYESSAIVGLLLLTWVAAHTVKERRHLIAGSNIFAASGEPAEPHLLMRSPK